MRGPLPKSIQLVKFTSLVFVKNAGTQTLKSLVNAPSLVQLKQ